MPRPCALRPTALALVCLLMTVGAVAVTMRPTGDRVSFDSIFEIWSSVLRDVDHVGVTMTRISIERKMEIGKAIGGRIDATLHVDDSSPRARYLAAVGASKIA